jgi:hypothetical protein
MRFELVNVTPELAARYLQKNEGNRKLREQHSASLARAMEGGQYKLTHQAAALTKRGRLIDGQHRMRAIVLSGKTIPMWIAHDVPDDVFAVLDSGLPRKMHERLRSNPAKTAVCTSMFRLMVRTPKAQDYEIQLMLELFEKALDKWAEIPKLVSKKGFTAGHSSALVLRLASAIHHKNTDEVSRLQWLAEKLTRSDMTGAPPVMHSFYRQLSEGVANLDLGVAPLTDQFCRAWRAFDVDNEAVTKLQITDHSLDVKAARLEFKFITEGVFD